MAIGESIARETADQQGALPRSPLNPAAATRARLQAARAREADVRSAAPVEAPAVPRRERPKNRKPFGSHDQRLYHPPIPGFHIHWFNDTPGRLQRAKEAGYEHVTDADGNILKRVVGVADGRPDGLYAYLMKIPEEWYQEDYDEAQAELEQRLSDIRKGRTQVENSYVGANHRIAVR